MHNESMMQITELRQPRPTPRPRRVEPTAQAGSAKPEGEGVDERPGRVNIVA